MRGNLRLVAAVNECSAETLTEAAMQPLPAGIPPEAIDARAHALARDVVATVMREEEPAILASVTLVIPDQPMKVAFLEAIGTYLLATKTTAIGAVLFHALSNNPLSI
jgi:hypothetical protein